MYVIISLIAVLLILSLLFFAHEFGHFVMAKRAGVRVEEFAFGFPPRIFAVRRGETEYALNALPIGAYVRFTGEEDPAQERSLASRTPWQRTKVLVAGPAMNALLGIIFFTITFMLGVPVMEPTGEVVIVGVAKDSPAAMAGLRPNDVVLRLDGHSLKSITDLQMLIEERVGQEVTFLIKRNGEVMPPITLVPRANPPAGQGPTGIQIANYHIVVKSFAPWEALFLGMQRTAYVAALTFYVPILVIKGLIPASQARPVGVVGIAQMTGLMVAQIPTNGLVPLLNFIGLISVSLGLVNMLPLPGLDGGRLAFVVLEWLRRGKRVSPQMEGMIHLVGMAILIALMLIITYYDIVNPVQLPDIGLP